MESTRVREHETLSFGELLREYRLAAGLSQQSLAELACMSTIGVGALERGDRRAPYRKTVQLLAAALNLSVERAQRLEAAALRAARRPRRLRHSAAEHQSRLPVNLNSFIGRETEVCEVAGLVRQSRLVTLTGTGGVGKTRTAAEVGSRLRDTDAGTVWFVDLSPLRDPSSVATAIATVLGLKESPNRSVEDALLEVLKKNTTVLILDNCEHLVRDAALLVNALLRGCVNLRILATSREPLRVDGERTYRLPSLAVPAYATTHDLSANQAVSYSAIALFVDRARASDNRFAITDENAPAIAEICSRLDGIPLAIELAAARVRIISIATLLAKLGKHFDVLTGGNRTAITRHQTMRALIDWSYDLLSHDETALLRYLSLFAGGFTLELAQAVCPAKTTEEGALELLTSLIDKSFVHVDFQREVVRYRLLESTRQYAFAKLVECNEEPVARSFHASAMLDLAEQLDADWICMPDELWTARVEAEVQNWRAVLTWAFENGNDPYVGARIACALRLPWWYLAAWEGTRWIEIALKNVDARAFPAIAARLELAAAYLCNRFGRFVAAVTASRRALTLFEECDDAFGIADAERCLGRGLLLMERVDEGQPYAERALVAFRSLGLDKMAGLALEDLGNARSLRNDVSGARACFEEAIALFDASGAERLASRVGLPLAEAEFREGNYEAAILAANRALATQRRLNDARFVEVALSNIAGYLIAIDRWNDARTHAREALSLACEHPGGYNALWALQHLAAVAALRDSASKPAARNDICKAAMLLGFIEARLPRLDAFREFSEQREFERIRARLLDEVGVAELERLLTAGGAMTDELAIASAFEL